MIMYTCRVERTDPRTRTTERWSFYRSIKGAVILSRYMKLAYGSGVDGADRTVGLWEQAPLSKRKLTLTKAPLPADVMREAQHVFDELDLASPIVVR